MTERYLRSIGRVPVAAALMLTAFGAQVAASPQDHSIVIRAEEARSSEIARIVHSLADDHGPRLTASPAAHEAARWAADELAKWGLADVRLKPWTFGHPGWRNVRSQGHLLLDEDHQLTFGVVAWTPGTQGPVSAEVIQIDPPLETNLEALDQYLRSVGHRVAGRIVLVGRSQTSSSNAAPRSLDAATLAMIRSGRAPAAGPLAPKPTILTRRQRDERIDAFLVKERAAVRVDDAGRPYGDVGARANWTFDVSKAIPSVTLRNEDYGRVTRLLNEKRPVRMRFNILNRSNPDGTIAYNVVADIPGSDKTSELVILGAHLDSWHLASGAVDNAVGCAIMMEAARLIRTLGLQPRRTIRIILWSGEEQGLLGSQAYVASHFGTAEKPRPEFTKVAAYVNIDGGSGRVRGANIFGPPEAADMLRTILAPVTDLGVEGAISHSVRRLGATGATTFSRAGLTAIGLIQDPLDYALAWHGSLDTYERIDDGQARQAAVVVTTLALSLANQELMPAKFSASMMPAPIGPPPTSPEP